MVAHFLLLSRYVGNRGPNLRSRDFKLTNKCVYPSFSFLPTTAVIKVLQNTHNDSNSYHRAHRAHLLLHRTENTSSQLPLTENTSSQLPLTENFSTQLQLLDFTTLNQQEEQRFTLKLFFLFLGPSPNATSQKR